MTQTKTEQPPDTCIHYGGKKKCAAGWFHSKCCLCYKCIRCPEFEPKEKKQC